MRRISKAFPGSSPTRASTSRPPQGEVHALLGENGAGKTTLMNILTGLYRPDEGEIEVFGRPVHFTSPRDAIEAGIGMVHQHFRLVERLTVAENVMLGWHTPRFWLSRASGCAPDARDLRGARNARAAEAPHLAALGGRAAAGRGHQGRLPRLPHPHPRRADRRAHPAGGGAALRDAPHDGARGPCGDRDHPQAERGDGRRRPRHRPAPGPARRDRDQSRGDAAVAGSADGRP